MWTRALRSPRLPLRACGGTSVVSRWRPVGASLLGVSLLGASLVGGFRRMTAFLTPPAADGMGERAATAVKNAGLEVELVKCLDDNYCPIIHHTASGATVIVDTPEFAPIMSVLKARSWTPTHIFNTHHHADHVGGNLELKTAFPAIQIVGPADRIYEYPGPYPPKGPEHEQIPGIDVVVREGDTVDFGALKAQVLEVGGHTSSHIAYFFPEVPLLLSGDCLFTMGCGRVFTGDFGNMFRSLKKLRGLPDETVVYSAHEYTASNVKFAVQVEPDNPALREREAQVAALRADGSATVPTLLAHEKETNPFLRWDQSSIQGVTGQADHEAVFAAVRRWKDTGKRPEGASGASRL